MKKIICSKGTPEQMLDAFRSKIAELEGGGITSATILSADDAYRGTPEDLLDAVRNKIDELESNDFIESATNTANIAVGTGSMKYQDMNGSVCGLGEICDVSDLEKIYAEGADDPVIAEYNSFDEWLQDSIDNGYLNPIYDEVEAGCHEDDKDEIEGAAEEIIPEGDIVTREVVQAADGGEDDEDGDYEFDDEEYLDDDQFEYINKLEGMLQDWGINGAMDDSIDSILMDHDDENIYITITFDDTSVVEYEVPLEDLTFGSLIEDFEYITNEIEKED